MFLQKQTIAVGMTKNLRQPKTNFIPPGNKKNREKIRNASKKYKSLLSSKSRGFHEKRRQRLKQTKIKNPRVYWEMIKGRVKGNNVANISVDEFGNFFKNLNSQDTACTSNLSLDTPQKDSFDE